MKNKLRTIEAQIVQKLKNNEPRPKFTDSCKKSMYKYGNFQFVEKYQLSVFARSLQNRERLNLDIFQNGGLVENLKFGRKNRSFLA